jgi:UDP-N-acetylmuramyl pentapeptide synthase
MNPQDEFDTSLIRGAKGFSSDSRADLYNKVFVAIKGATHDGHSFINES